MLRATLLLSGYLGRALTQFLILWAFARTAGAAGAGEFAFALAVTSPVMALFELALRNVYQTLSSAPPFRAFFTLRVGFSAAACVLVFAASAAIDRFPSPTVLAPLLVMRYADSVLDICWARLQVLGQVPAVAGWLWVNTVLSTIPIVLTVVLSLDPRVAIVGSAAVSVGVLLALGPRLLRASEPYPAIPRRPDANRILRAGLVLGIAQTLGSSVTYLPTLYLAAAASKADVGVFAACQFAVTMANLFFNSVLQTWLSPMRRSYDTNGFAGLRARALRTGVYCTGIGALGTVLMLVTFPTLLRVVFGDEFAVSAATVLPFALTVVILAFEYAVSGPLLVANMYGSRLIAVLWGAVPAVVVAVATRSDATVATAGYIVLAASVGRAASAAWYLRGFVSRATATAQTV